MAEIRVKRVYEAPARGDGCRVLVDRVWPRGIAKSRARLDLWLKEVAPSTVLRKWFAHDPEKWLEFRERYWRELRKQPDAIATLQRRRTEGTVTLVYGARDEEHNNAIALKQFLEQRGRVPGA